MPTKKISKKKEKAAKRDKPWITQGLKVSIHKKFELLDKFRISKLQEDNLKYKKHLNLLTHLIKKAEFLYYRDLSIIYGNDKSKTWKLVNEISHRKRKKVVI